MSDFLAHFTADGSVGLYNSDINDIYHSSSGALTEAYEKFILPSNIDNFLNNHNEIKILDICYGIGYNSKAFLNYFLKNYFYKKNKNFSKNLANKHKHIGSIDTDNILSNNLENNFKIILHGVDIDKNLIQISPFIKQEKNLFKYKIENKNFYISDIVNYFILFKLQEKYKSDYMNYDLINLMRNKGYKKFFNPKISTLIKKNVSGGYKTSYNDILLAVLHNIYYRYLSISYKKALKLSKNSLFDVELFDMDARKFIKNINLKYDFVFLDAFSPLKAPCLWSVEFFRELYNHTTDDCMILTYSNSAAIRNAFLKNNFYVGKIFNKRENKFTGTIAVKNKSYIKFPLDENDLGLINTKAGICFRDENLNLSNTEILNIRKIEAENSNLISATQYKKELKCTI